MEAPNAVRWLKPVGGDPHRHEIKTFSFENGMVIEVQVDQILSLAKIKRRLAGLVTQRFWFDHRSQRWIEHSAWSPGFAPTGIVELSASEAAALLKRVGLVLDLEELKAASWPATG